MFDLISIGDGVIDTYIPLLEAEVISTHGGNERKLCLRYGDKIPVGAALSVAAGNPVNNVIGAAKLGLKAACYIHIGDDEEGEQIKKSLKNAGVDTRYLKVEADFPTNHNYILNFAGERTILSHHQPWDYDLPELEKSRWVYFTSLAPSFPQTQIVPQLLEYLERTGAKLFFNPGTFQIHYGIRKFPQLLALTEVFILNLEEAKIVLGYEEGDNVGVRKLLQGLADLGPRKVVITDGAEGSYGYDEENFYQLKVFPAEVVEMTGAGDAYATALLAGLFYGEEFSEAMRWGAANSASVVEKVGPQAGLLDLEQLKRKLRQCRSIQPERL